MSRVAGAPRGRISPSRSSSPLTLLRSTSSPFSIAQTFLDAGVSAFLRNYPLRLHHPLIRGDSLWYYDLAVNPYPAPAGSREVGTAGFFLPSLRSADAVGGSPGIGALSAGGCGAVGLPCQHAPRSVRHLRACADRRSRRESALGRRGPHARAAAAFILVAVLLRGAVLLLCPHVVLVGRAKAVRGIGRIRDVGGGERALLGISIIVAAHLARRRKVFRLLVSPHRRRRTPHAATSSAVRGLLDLAHPGPGARARALRLRRDSCAVTGADHTNLSDRPARRLILRSTHPARKRWMLVSP